MLWLSGELQHQLQQGQIWKFIGVFEDEDKAVLACFNDHCFVAPCLLNHAIIGQDYNWRQNGAYYPRLEKRLVTPSVEMLAALR